jgi:N-acetylglutamate synthase-like GNAT family acetyltransferase
MSENLEIRRARRGDLAAITSLVQQATKSRIEVDDAKVTEWLFTKGLWVALLEEELVGVAAWQAENLVSVTDVFHVSPADLLAEVGSRLLETIESEAGTLMCEVNVILVPAWVSWAVQSFLQKQGYETRNFEDLHRIYREVLGDFDIENWTLMVKQLRDRMVMVPL